MTQDHTLMDSTPAGRKARLHDDKKQKHWWSNLCVLILAIGTWKRHLIVEKEPKFMSDVKRYQLDVLRLTSTNNKGSGTNLLGRVWNIFHSGVPVGERR